MGTPGTGRHWALGSKASLCIMLSWVFVLLSLFQTSQAVNTFDMKRQMTTTLGIPVDIMVDHAREYTYVCLNNTAVGGNGVAVAVYNSTTLKLLGSTDIGAGNGEPVQCVFTSATPLPYVVVVTSTHPIKIARVNVFTAASPGLVSVATALTRFIKVGFAMNLEKYKAGYVLVGASSTNHLGNPESALWVYDSSTGGIIVQARIHFDHFSLPQSGVMEAATEHLVVTGVDIPNPPNLPVGHPDHDISPPRPVMMVSIRFKWDGPILKMAEVTDNLVHYPPGWEALTLGTPIFETATVRNPYPNNNTFTHGRLAFLGHSSGGGPTQRVAFSRGASTPFARADIFGPLNPILAKARLGADTFYMVQDNDNYRAELLRFTQPADNVTQSIDIQMSGVHRCVTDETGGSMNSLQTSLFCISNNGVARIGVDNWFIINDCHSLNNTGAVTGTYLAKNPAIPTAPASPIYCDTDTADGTWTALARFTQTAGIDQLKVKSPETIERFFKDSLWIQGNSHGPPLEKKDHFSDYEIESVNWAHHLKAGDSYELRQQCWKTESETFMFDFGFNFQYSGWVVQQDGADPDFVNTTADNAFEFRSRSVFYDGSGITWDASADDIYRFWLPAKTDYPGTEHEVLTGCDGFSWQQSSTDCSGYRGHAGIIGREGDSNDPAAGFLPQHGVNLPGTRDLVRVNQAVGVYGTSGDKITCMYYFRPARAQAWPRSCADLKAGAPSGMYQVAPVLNGPRTRVYCDNAAGNENGGWMLMSKFSSTGGANWADQEEYDYYFANADWMTGGPNNMLTPPLSPLARAEYSSGGRVESQDWSKFLIKGNRYRLRQQCSWDNPARAFDRTWQFEFTGNMFQQPNGTVAERSWRLYNGNSISDTSGIGWTTNSDSADPKRFVLPIRKSDGPFKEMLCRDGMQTTCDASGFDYGAAGISTDSGSTQREGAYLPYITSTAGKKDWARVFGAGANFNGGTNDPVTCNYYIKPFMQSCDDLQRYKPGLLNGLYTFKNSSNFGATEWTTYCDMVTADGPWTLLSRFDGKSSLSGLTNGAYDAIFATANWIKGLIDPPTGDVGVAAAFALPTDYRIQGINWGSVIEKDQVFKLRQRCEYRNFTDDEGVDLQWEFAATGRITQDVTSQNSLGFGKDISTLTDRHWILLNRKEIQNTHPATFIFKPQATTYFWLPIEDYTAGDDLLCGASYTTGEGFEYGQIADLDGLCQPANSTRVKGSAGVIADHGQFPGFAHLPNVGQHPGFPDTGVAVSAPSLFGSTGGELSCGYYFKPVDDIPDSCEQALKREPARGSGTYHIFNKAASGKTTQVYCDQTTDGGGWTLLSYFSQHQSIGHLEDTRYFTYFNQTTTWMDGQSEGPPLSVEPDFTDYHIRSHDWAEFITPGKDYQLRQRCSKFQNQTMTLDFRFDFVGTATTHQGAALADKYFKLARRTILQDNTGITHSTDPEGMDIFYVPANPTVTPFMCGLNNYEVDADCGGAIVNQTHRSYRRRWGNAGVVQRYDGKRENTHGFSFLPQTGANEFVNMDRADIAHLSGYPNIYGETGHEMACQYYVREHPGVKSSCHEWKKAFPSSQNGVYLIRVAGETTSRYLYCQMDAIDTDKMWTLMAKFSQNAPINTLSPVAYSASFQYTHWIDGSTNVYPETPKPIYDAFHFESVNWEKFLEKNSVFDLRQRCSRHSNETDMIDMAFTFVYNGRVTQLDFNNQPKIDQKSWIMSDKRILASNLPQPIPWDDNPGEVLRFWLPFTDPSLAFPSRMLTGCNGFEFDPSACDSTTAAKRVFGNAGIVGERGDSKDVAFTFMPFTPGNAIYGADLAKIYINQTGNIEPLYGDKGEDMVCTYWTRPRKDDIKPLGSCQEIYNDDPSKTDGVYLIAVAPQNTTYRYVYCDMTTMKGGWTLLSKFSQNEGVDQMSFPRYFDLFRTKPIWIDGEDGADGVPLSPKPEYDGIRIESQRWSEFLEKGKHYQLRQQCFKDGETYPTSKPRRHEFDLSFDFHYGGTTMQSTTKRIDEKGWVLSNRQIISQDPTVDFGFDNSTTGVDRFWLPFDDLTATAGTNYLLTSCGGGDYTIAACNHATTRRYGNAGIQKQFGVSGSTTGAAWLPHMDDSSGTADIVKLLGAGSTLYGSTGENMTCMYYLRDRPKIVNETFPSSCSEVLAANPAATSGVYEMDDLHNPGENLHNVHCDMTTADGGWTLLSKFEQTGSIDTLSSADYDRLFNNAGKIWIEGESDNELVTPNAMYTQGPALTVESLDWQQHLLTGKHYQLRQRCEQGANVVDTKYEFVYPGHILQNSAGAPAASQAWKLEEPVTISNTAGVVWDWPNNENIWFWPPFKAPVTGDVVTQCLSFEYGNAGTCLINDDTRRRFGNAGIAGATTDSLDPGVWVPHLSTVPAGYDIGLVHQSGATFGTSGAQMQCTYYVRDQPDGPVVTAVDTRTPTSGGTITVTGSNFGPLFNEVEIMFDDQPCANPLWLSETEAKCDIPAGTGASHNVSIKVGTQTSPKLPLYTYQSPKVWGWEPVPADGAKMIINDIVTIHGENFGETASTPIIEYEPTTKFCLTPTWVSPNVLTCKVTTDMFDLDELAVTINGLRENFKIKRYHIRNTGGAKTNAAVPLYFDSAAENAAGDIDTACRKIYAYQENKTPVPYLVDPYPGCLVTNTRVWIRIANFPANSITCVSLLLGSNVPTTPEPANIFATYEDFEYMNDPMSNGWTEDKLGDPLPGGDIFVTSPNTFDMVSGTQGLRVDQRTKNLIHHQRGATLSKTVPIVNDLNLVAYFYDTMYSNCTTWIPPVVETCVTPATCFNTFIDYDNCSCVEYNHTMALQNITYTGLNCTQLNQLFIDESVSAQVIFDYNNATNYSAVCTEVHRDPYPVWAVTLELVKPTTTIYEVNCAQWNCTKTDNYTIAASPYWEVGPVTSDCGSCLCTNQTLAALDPFAMNCTDRTCNKCACDSYNMTGAVNGVLPDICTLFYPPYNDTNCDMWVSIPGLEDEFKIGLLPGPGNSSAEYGFFLKRKIIDQPPLWVNTTEYNCTNATIPHANATWWNETVLNATMNITAQPGFYESCKGDDCPGFFTLLHPNFTTPCNASNNCTAWCSANECEVETCAPFKQYNFTEGKPYFDGVFTTSLSRSSKWHKLEFTWKSANQETVVSMDDQFMFSVPNQSSATGGFIIGTGNISNTDTFFDGVLSYSVHDDITVTSGCLSATCRRLARTGLAPSGAYTVQYPSMQVPKTVYCDNGAVFNEGWVLLAKFGQTKSVTLLPNQTYSDYFRDGLWAHGNSEQYPTTPIPNFAQDYNIESVDWREVFVKGNAYELRQRCGRTPAMTTDTFDVRAKFIYNGYVAQPDTERAGDHYWDLVDHEINTGSGFVPHTGPPRYILPTRPGHTNANIVSCNGTLTRSADACQAEVRRMWGNAGIAGTAGASWLPLTAVSNFTHIYVESYQNQTFYNATFYNATHGKFFQNGTQELIPNPFTVDIARVFDQSTTRYGQTGETIGCQYYARELDDVLSPPVYPTSCTDLKVTKPASVTGSYLIKPPGLPGTQPIVVFCDFDTVGGHWTLLSRFDSDGTPLQTSSYNDYFKDNLWIEGHSEGPPTSYLPEWEYTGTRIYSQDWRLFHTKDEPYQLRQRCESKLGQVWDAHYTFVYNGYVTQQNGTRMREKSWILGEPTVITNTVPGMTADVPQDAVLRFWLPWTSKYGNNGPLGCGEGYDDTTCVGIPRSEGSAGIGYHDIATHTAGRPNPGIEWMPNTVAGEDIARTFQANAIFGASTSPMTCTYSTRPLVTALPKNCTDVFNQVGLANATSGVYYIKDDHFPGTIPVYCDMKTVLQTNDTLDTGGITRTPWTLMAKFSQPASFFNLTQQDFLDYFYNNLWIEGHAQDPPLSPLHLNFGYHIESLDWRLFMTARNKYQIRQTCAKPGDVDVVDHMFDFVYNGLVRQESGQPRDNSSWVLVNHRYLEDTSLIAWNTPSTDVTRFYLPFAKDRSKPMCGLNGYTTTDPTCAGLYGSAGIIGVEADNADPGFGFLPYSDRMNTDIAHVAQATGTYGTTGQAMTCTYYIREAPPLQRMTSCHDHQVRIEGPPGANSTNFDLAKDGMYHVHPLAAPCPVPVYCDMHTDRGGWTLLSKFSQHKTFSELPNAMWRESFLDGLWMLGDTSELPYSMHPEYDDYHIESYDWRWFIDPSKPYRLRQTCEKIGTPWLLGVTHNDSGLVFTNDTELKTKSDQPFGFFDVRVDVQPTTNFFQPDNNAFADHFWVTSNPFYLNNSDNIQFDAGPPDDPMKFILPLNSLNRTATIVTQCDGLTVKIASQYYSEGGCAHNTTLPTEPWRELGNVGFTHDTVGYPLPKSYGASYLPFTRQRGYYTDLALVTQHPTVYGFSGDRMRCAYLIRDDDYAPIVTATTNATAVGGPLVITGTGFGSVQNFLLTVTVDGTTCSSPVWLSPTQVRCTAPPGIGPGHDVRVTRNGYESEYKPIMGYQPPLINTVSQAPTVGGEITLRGVNFGPFNNPITVTLDGSTCATPAWVSDTVVTCDAPPGTGAAHTVFLESAGQWNVDGTSNVLFSYELPRIDDVSTVFTRTGGVITISGANFAVTDPTPTITVGGSACATPTWLSDSSLTCVQPPGVGGSLPVLVTVDSQVNLPANLGWYYGIVDWDMLETSFTDFVDDDPTLQEKTYEDVVKFNCSDCSAINRFQLSYNASYDSLNFPQTWRPLQAPPTIVPDNALERGTMTYSVRGTQGFDTITPPGRDIVFEVQLFFISFGREFNAPERLYITVNTDPPPPPIIEGLELVIGSTDLPPVTTSCDYTSWELIIRGKYFGVGEANFTGTTIAGVPLPVDSCAWNDPTTVRCRDPPEDPTKWKTGPVGVTTLSGSDTTASGLGVVMNYVINDAIVTAVTPRSGDAAVAQIITLHGRHFLSTTNIDFQVVSNRRSIGISCNSTSPYAFKTGALTAQELEWVPTDSKMLCKLDPSPVPFNATIFMTRKRVLVPEESCTVVSEAHYLFVGPVVSSVSPNVGLTTGNQNITITGSAFGPSIDGLKVTLNDVPCWELFYISSTQIVCRSQNTTTAFAGQGPVIVTTTKGGVGVAGLDKAKTWFTYMLPVTATGYDAPYPHVKAVNPPSGNPLVENVITVTGLYFGTNRSDVEMVRMNRLTEWERKCEILTGYRNTTNTTFFPNNKTYSTVITTTEKGWLDDKNIECTLPAFKTREEVLALMDRNPQILDVRTYSGGPSLQSAGAFRYEYPPPEIHGIYPRIGHTTGGTNVTIVGEYFGETAPDFYLAMQGPVACRATYYVSHDRMICQTVTISKFPDSITKNNFNFTVTVNGQRSAPFRPQPDGFVYEADASRICEPSCGFHADCRRDKIPSYCECHHFWADEPQCEKAAIQMEVKKTRSNEDQDLRGVISLTLNRQPTAYVNITFMLNETENVRLNHKKPFKVSQHDYKRVRYIAAYGLPDALRDGDTPFAINFTVQSDDPWFDKMPLPDVEMKNLESRATIEYFEPRFLPIQGARVTLRGRNFDEQFRIRINGFQVDLGFNLDKIIGPLDDFGRPVIKTRNGTNTSRSVALSEWSAAGDRRDMRYNLAQFDTFLPPVITNELDENDPRGPVNITTVEFEAPWAEWDPATGYADVEIINIRGSYTRKRDLLYYSDTCLPPGEFGDPGNCRPCPVGGICPGGNRLWPKAGFWNPDEQSGFVRQCDPPSSCVGCEGALRQEDCYSGLEDQPGALCGPTFQGEFCADCIEGHVTVLGQCVPCPPKAEWLGYLFADLSVWLILGLAAAAVEHRDNFGLVVNVYQASQTVGVVGSMVDPRLATWATSIFRVFGLFIGDIDFIQAECSMGRTDFETNFWLAMVYNIGLFIPIGVLVLAVGKYVRHKLKDEDILVIEERREHYLYRLRYAFQVWLTLVYYNLTHRAFEAVGCIPMSGQHRSMTVLSHQCYVMPHWPVYFAGHIILFGVTLGVPAYQLHRMRQNREILYTDREFQESYAFVYDCYLLKWRFFYLLDYFTLACFAAADTVLREFSTFRLGAIVLPIGIHLILTVILMPFRRWWDNLVTVLQKLSVAGTAALIYMNSKGIMKPEESEGPLYGIVAAACLAVLLKLCVAFYYVFIVWKDKTIVIPEYEDRIKAMNAIEEEEDNAEDFFQEVFQGESQESLDQQDANLQNMIMQPFLDLSQMFMNVAADELGDDYDPQVRTGQSNIVKMMRAREAANAISRDDAADILGDDILAEFDDRPVFRADAWSEDDAASIGSVASVRSVQSQRSLDSMPSLRTVDSETDQATM